MFDVELIAKFCDGYSKSSTEETAWLSKKIVMPFAPHNDLIISLDFEHRVTGFGVTEKVAVKRVIWLDHDGRFICRCKTSYMNSMLKPDIWEINFEEALQDKLDRGWDGWSWGEKFGRREAPLKN